LCAWLIVNRPPAVFVALRVVVFFFDDARLVVVLVDDARAAPFCVAFFFVPTFRAPVFLIVRFFIGGNTFPSYMRDSAATYVAAPQIGRSVSRGPQMSMTSPQVAWRPGSTCTAARPLATRSPNELRSTLVPKRRSPANGETAARGTGLKEEGVLMAVKAQLQEDLTAAMRSRDEVVVATLRMLLAAVRKAEVAGKSQVELSDDQIVGVARSELRKRTEASEMYRSGGRPELADREAAEADVLRRYLPAELGDDALERIVAEEVVKAAASGLTGGKAMGSVVKAVRERVGAQAEGGRVAAAVKAALQ
jgi:uncharacterized protein YqeY